MGTTRATNRMRNGARFRIYGTGNDGYMRNHVVAILESANEPVNGDPLVMWAADDVGENADFMWRDGRIMSCKYPSHCIAVYESGDGVAGDKLVTWDAGDTGVNAEWHRDGDRFYSHRNGGENHVMAVYEDGDGPNGFALCTWPDDDTGANAEFRGKFGGMGNGEVFRVYGHGENGYMKNHVIAIYETQNEGTNGDKVIMWDGDDVGENADWMWEEGQHGGRQLVSAKYPSHCCAVYESGDGVAGDRLVTWDRGDVGANAEWHKKGHRMWSHRNGGEDHVMAVYEEGDGPNGFELCTWPRGDTGKNAKFHWKFEMASSTDESD